MLAEAIDSNKLKAVITPATPTIGKPVPNVPHLRVLGLTIPQNGSGSHTIAPLQRTLSQLMHLIHRVSNRRFGMQEFDTLRIVQAILISRVAYGTPYLSLKTTEKSKLNIALRQAYKTALGLPPKTLTKNLLLLGIHNTWEELQEAHHISQLERLKLTPTGRATLRKLGYATPSLQDHKERIPLHLRKAIRVAQIPKNMHPVYNKARRIARARTMNTKYGDSPTARYTDASPYPHKPAHAVCVTNAAGQEMTALTVRTTYTEAAEEIAIALAATTGGDIITVLTDPQAAARAHTHRAITREGTTSLVAPTTDLLINYADILAHYRHDRRKYPAPHPRLSRDEATTLRRLQTNTYPHSTLLHAIYPAQYAATCNFCPSPGNLYHQVWECQRTPDLTPKPTPSYEQWMACLTSPDPGIQQDLVTRARIASRSQGIPD
ncbi:uncharacterized protein LOC120837552 [Ixodes scapularis]|uniref:uncharacterized protein LOC120837552 n=1 Tax=Ixodes scapularis TaxID=6945 RepID=UPI001C3838BF|nr:uncharacterized protein LOC120837552 [Ixodes scapularis]